jgi:hypothetical protein
MNEDHGNSTKRTDNPKSPSFVGTNSRFNYNSEVVQSPSMKVHRNTLAHTGELIMNMSKTPKQDINSPIYALKDKLQDKQMNMNGTKTDGFNNFKKETPTKPKTKSDIKHMK